MVKKYESMEKLLEDFLPRQLPEDPRTKELMRAMIRAKEKGRFDKGPSGEIWAWKHSGMRFAASNRRYLEGADNSEIVRASRAVLASYGRP